MTTERIRKSSGEGGGVSQTHEMLRDVEVTSARRNVRLVRINITTGVHHHHVIVVVCISGVVGNGRGRRSWWMIAANVIHNTFDGCQNGGRDERRVREFAIDVAPETGVFLVSARINGRGVEDLPIIRRQSQMSKTRMFRRFREVAYGKLRRHYQEFFFK